MSNENVAVLTEQNTAEDKVIENPCVSKSPKNVIVVKPGM